MSLCVVVLSCFVFFFKQKTAYEMRISDWSSDVCSSDLDARGGRGAVFEQHVADSIAEVDVGHQLLERQRRRQHLVAERAKIGPATLELGGMRDIRGGKLGELITVNFELRRLRKPARNRRAGLGTADRRPVIARLRKAG